MEVKADSSLTEFDVRNGAFYIDGTYVPGWILEPNRREPGKMTEMGFAPKGAKIVQVISGDFANDAKAIALVRCWRGDEFVDYLFALRRFLPIKPLFFQGCDSAGALHILDAKFLGFR